MAVVELGLVVAEPEALGLLAAVIVELQAQALGDKAVELAVQVHPVEALVAGVEDGPEAIRARRAVVLGGSVGWGGVGEEAVALGKGQGPERLQGEIAVNVEGDQVPGAGRLLVALGAIEQAGAPGPAGLDVGNQFGDQQLGAAPGMARLHLGEGVLGGLVVVAVMEGNESPGVVVFHC